MNEIVTTKSGMFDISRIPKDSKINQRVKPFRSGDFAKYRVYNSYDPTTKKYTLNDLYLPSTDVIADPDTGQEYDIAYITQRTTGGDPVFGDIWFTAGTFCTIVLNGDKLKDRQLYEYLERCNYNVSNPYRDKGRPALIERIESGSDAKVLRDIRKQKQQAFNILDAMSDEEVTSFLRSKNMHVPADEGQRREAVENFIDNKGAKEFLSSSATDASGTLSLMEEIEKLKKSEVIAYDKQARIWSSKSGDMILNVKKGSTVDAVAELALYFGTPKGEKALKELQDPE